MGREVAEIKDGGGEVVLLFDGVYIGKRIPAYPTVENHVLVVCQLEAYGVIPLIIEIEKVSDP